MDQDFPPRKTGEDGPSIRQCERGQDPIADNEFHFRDMVTTHGVMLVRHEEAAFQHFLPE